MKRRPLDAKEELVEEFERALRVSEYLVSVLPRRLWRAERPDGHGRSIAATGREHTWTCGNSRF